MYPSKINAVLDLPVVTDKKGSSSFSVICGVSFKTNRPRFLGRKEVSTHFVFKCRDFRYKYSYASDIETMILRKKFKGSIHPKKA